MRENQSVNIEKKKDKWVIEEKYPKRTNHASEEVANNGNIFFTKDKNLLISCLKLIGFSLEEAQNYLLEEFGEVFEPNWHDLPPQEGV